MDGIRIALNKGVQGHEVIDVKITFLEADYDSVMGTPADFRRLVPIALKKALDDAAVEILEPWQNFIVSVPVEYDKTVLNDICKMKARIIDYQYGETYSMNLKQSRNKEVKRPEQVVASLDMGEVRISYPTVLLHNTTQEFRPPHPT